MSAPPVSSGDTWRGPPRRLPLSYAAWRRLCQIHGGELAVVPAGVRLSYAALTRYGSVLGRLQRRLHPPADHSLPSRAVFVVGHWRSGTSLLHELLAQDSQFVYPTTYACMNPLHFMLTEAGSVQLHDRAVQRPMDQMQISAQSPQEDEFALLAMGARSPYEAVLFPQRLPQALATLEFSRLSDIEQRQWRAAFRRFCSLLATRAPGRTLLLKSPPHAGRIAALRALLPQARFVHLVREPGAVSASTVGMWQALFREYALTPPPWPDVAPQVIPQLARLDRLAAAELDGRDDVCRLRFEDLLARPQQELARIYRELDLGDAAALAPAVSRYLEAATQRAPRQWTHSERDVGLLQRHCGEIRRRYGYGSGPAGTA